jgi:protein involved in polysaccharide export with SLBB domain
MKTFVCWAALLSCVLLTGCGGSGAHPAYPGASSVSGSGMRDVIRVGDKITIRLTGVPDDGFFTEVQVPASGDINVNLLTQSFHAVGETPSELAAQIAEAYKAQRIYTNPVVTVLPEERFINVSGDVRGPQRVVYSPDSTLITTIISCGGFTEYADRRHIRIIRGSQTIIVDGIKAQGSPGNDPPVLPGDQIYIPRTPF